MQSLLAKRSIPSSARIWKKGKHGSALTTYTIELIINFMDITTLRSRVDQKLCDEFAYKRPQFGDALPFCATMDGCVLESSIVNTRFYNIGRNAATDTRIVATLTKKLVCRGSQERGLREDQPATSVTASSAPTVTMSG
jgi:hypothetical protein